MQDPRYFKVRTKTHVANRVLRGGVATAWLHRSPPSAHSVDDTDPCSSSYCLAMHVDFLFNA